MLVITIRDTWDTGSGPNKRTHVSGTLTPSGDYPAGGDVITSGIGDIALPIHLEATGFNGYFVAPIYGASLLSSRFKVGIGQGEIGTGAPGSTVPYSSQSPAIGTFDFYGIFHS